MRKLSLFPILAALVVLIFFCGCSKKPSSDEQIKQDLVGKTLSHYGGKQLWKFGAITEFEDFRIIGKKERNGMLEYTIDTIIIDQKNNSRYSTEFVVFYKYANKKWEISHLFAKKFAGPHG